MAQRRMFSPQIVDSDAFLEMPSSAQNLYFHLGMRADDDGFVGNPKKIMKFVNSGEDDLKILFAKRFIIGFENGIIVIKHWRMNNLIRKDWYRETPYTEQKSTLYIKKNGAYTQNPQETDDILVNEKTTESPRSLKSIDKDNKDSLDNMENDSKTIPSVLDKNLAWLLESCILQNLPNFKKQSLDKWADEIRKMREIDKRTPDQIGYVIKWCQNDSFWKANILSAATLRKQWDKLEARIRATMPQQGMNFDD